MDKRQQRKFSLRKIWNRRYSKKFLLKIMAIVTTFTICVLLILNVFIWSTDVSKLENPVPQPTIIYDQAGSVASKISTSNIEGVSIKQIPSNLINAVISTEDQRFYDHHGINYVGIARAMVKNLFSGEL